MARTRWMSDSGPAAVPLLAREIGRFFGRRVGGHLYGRFCRRGRIPAPPARRPDRNPRRLQVPGSRFPPDACGLLNPPQRPAQPAQGNYLLFLFFAQDIAHVDGAYSPVRVNVLAQLSHWPVFRWPPMAGFGWPPRLKGLEDENRRLKHLVADLSLDKEVLKAVISKNGWSLPA